MNLTIVIINPKVFSIKDFDYIETFFKENLKRSVLLVIFGNIEKPIEVINV